MQPLGENSANIPAFLGKLWKMVNDPNTDHLICWSTLGNSFIIQNQAQFWYELLPLYYKHNNMSSFVRQLNMYGFHKMSIVENGTMDADKDEIQFFHKYFQREKHELLRNIKRKVTTSKNSESNLQSILRHEDINKVLTDVKHLRGKQTSVDSQLSAMKQENVVLWRELALLRQKHIKQQQIVNKLIQFLVTLVQPSGNSRMGVRVKRRIPLMLHESPLKKLKTKKVNIQENTDNGPTIHELDNEIEISPTELFDENIEEHGLVTSPVASTSPPSNESNKAPSVCSDEGSVDDVTNNFWSKPEYVEISYLQKDVPKDDFGETTGNEVHLNKTPTETSDKVFLSPTAGDALLTNVVSGSYKTDIVNPKNAENINKSDVVDQRSDNSSRNTNKLTVATRNDKISNGCREDLDLHLEATQNEIDQLKDILHGNSLDANILLGLFNDETPDYGLSYKNATTDNPTNGSIGSGRGDPMVSGGELVNCSNNLIDFNELFDDSLDGSDINELTETDLSSTVNTPLMVKTEPMFPS